MVHFYTVMSIVRCAKLNAVAKLNTILSFVKHAHQSTPRTTFIFPADEFTENICLYDNNTFIMTEPKLTFYAAKKSTFPIRNQRQSDYELGVKYPFLSLPLGNCSAMDQTG